MPVAIDQVSIEYLTACPGANPGPKFTKIGDDLLPTQVYHPVKFHRPVSTHDGDIPYRKSADKHRNSKWYSCTIPIIMSCENNKAESQQEFRHSDRVVYKNATKLTGTLSSSSSLKSTPSAWCSSFTDKHYIVTRHTCHYQYSITGNVSCLQRQ